MKKHFLIYAFFPVLFACNTSSDKTQETKTETVVVDTVSVDTPVAAAPLVKEFKTKTGKTIVVTETHPTGASLSTIDVRFAGDTSAAMIFSDVDPISNILQGDLDGNGFDEIYIITQAAGSGSYGKVYGMVSNNDRSLTSAYMAEVSENDMKAGKKFEGYEGHDRFEIINNELVREFPIKVHGKSKRMIHYTLKPGEAAWQLVIKSSMEN